MQKSIVISGAVLLAACGVAVTTSNDVAESATQRARPKDRPMPPPDRFDRGGMAGCSDPNLSGYARAAAERIGGVPCERGAEGASSGASNAPSGSWAGRYEGQFDGGRGFVDIAPQSGGAYRVQLETVGQGTGCSGGATGTARPSGNVLSLSIRNENQPGICTVRLTRNGARLTVAENGCLEHHGMSCDFTGTVTRLGAVSQSQRRPSPSRAPSIIGSWAYDRADCRSDPTFTFSQYGEFYSPDQSGRWSLAGNTLTLLVTATHAGPMRTDLRTPRRIVHRVRLTGAALTIIWEGGQNPMSRC